MNTPWFAKDPSEFKEHLPRCVVKQKEADLDCWLPWIHQLLLYVGSARRGQSAKGRWSFVLGQRKGTEGRGKHKGGKGKGEGKGKGGKGRGKGGRQIWAAVAEEGREEKWVKAAESESDVD